jgi:hypothetical protein
MLGLGTNLNELKARVQKARDDLERLGVLEQPMPEMINTTNILRANEHLTKTDHAKAGLILAYEEYTKQLEQILLSLLSIQSDLKDIVGIKASMIGGPSSKKRTRKRPVRKKSKK